MKAIVSERYGSPDVMKLEEIPTPSPGDNELLVKIHAASINAYDWHLLRADPFLVRISGRGFFKPKINILGADFAGRVEAVGSHVKHFQPGDEVFGDLSANGDGAFAEYVAVPESSVVLKPATMSFEQAAAMPMAGMTALQALRDAGNLQPGQKLLINGTSGGVGTFAVQLAKVFGAEITGVCSTSKMEMARSLGADHVIDYTQEDVTEKDEKYDLILGINGYHSLSDYQRILAPKGVYIMVGGTTAQIFEALFLGAWKSWTGGKKMGMSPTKPNQKDLLLLNELFEAGKVVPVIDRTYPLAEVPEAIRYLENGHAKGKVIITME